MARKNYKWIIVDDAPLRVVVTARLDGRYECRSDNNEVFVVSKYDIYDTLHKATEVANEELPQ